MDRWNRSPQELLLPEALLNLFAFLQPAVEKLGAPCCPKRTCDKCAESPDFRGKLSESFMSSQMNK